MIYQLEKFATIFILICFSTAVAYGAVDQFHLLQFGQESVIELDAKVTYAPEAKSSRLVCQGRISDYVADCIDSASPIPAKLCLQRVDELSGCVSPNA